MCSPRWLIVLGGTLAALLSFPTLGSAGWILTQNDTKTTLFVQEVSAGPLPKRGKLIRLLPREVSRDFCPITQERRIQIWDPRKPGKMLFDGPISCPPGDVLLKIICEDGAIKVIPIPTPTRPKSPS